MNKTKKYLSLLLAVIMISTVFQMFPFTANAAAEVSGSTMMQFAENDIVAEDCAYSYDTNTHFVTVTAPKGATVKYGTEQGNYPFSDCPRYFNIGVYTIYYQISMENYETVTGSVQMTIYGDLKPSFYKNSVQETKSVNWTPNLSAFNTDDISFIEKKSYWNKNDIVSGIHTEWYDENNNLLSEAPTDAGVYTIKIKADEITDPAYRLVSDTLTYTIKPFDLSDGGVHGLVNQKTYTYNGEQQLPSGKWGLYGNSSWQLPEGSYHFETIEGKNCTEPGFAYCNVVGDGKNVIGSKELRYQIMKSQIELPDITSEHEIFYSVTPQATEESLINAIPVPEGYAAVEVLYWYNRDDRYTRIDTPVAPGEYNVYLRYIPKDTEHYNTKYRTESVVIKKAPLTVTAEDKSIIYGDTAPEYTVSYSGFRGTDTSTDLNGTLKFDCDCKQYDSQGTYSITPKGLTSDNYEIEYVQGTLTVNPKPVVVTIDNKSSIYGDELAELTAAANGIINNDKNIFKLRTEASKTAGVGRYDIIGTQLDNNYSITFVNEKNAYLITERVLTVDVIVADKQYDGLNTATISSATLNNIANGDTIGLLNGTAIFESVRAAKGINISFSDFHLSGDADILKNYTLLQPKGIKANIINNWEPAAQTEYTLTDSNENGWINENFIITAKNGYKLSLSNTADGDWSDTLTQTTEGAGKSVIFYVKNTADGAISLAKTETYNMDKNTENTGTTGKVSFNKKTSWKQFLNTISFGLFFKSEVTVKAEATDALSGVAKIEYIESDKALTFDEIKAVSNWEAMPASGVRIMTEDAKQFVYYIRITDIAGNITYISTDGAEYDIMPPTINGIENGANCFTTRRITVDDRNLDTVTLNGEAVTENLILEGNREIIYTIIATDKVGNSTTYTVTMKPIKTISETIESITELNVKSTDQNVLQEVLDKASELLNDDDLTDAEKTELEAMKGNAEKLIAKIESTDEAAKTENIQKVEDITFENVNKSDRADLEKAKEDLEKALENNGENYTDIEKKVIKDKIKRIDDAITVLDNIQSVEDKINGIPQDITEKEETAVKAAEEAYNALSDYEKTLVSKDAKEKLDAAKIALDAAKNNTDTTKTAPDAVNKTNKSMTSPATGNNSNCELWLAMLFIEIGVFMFICIPRKSKKSNEGKI